MAHLLPWYLLVLVASLLFSLLLCCNVCVCMCVWECVCMSVLTPGRNQENINCCFFAFCHSVFLSLYFTFWAVWKLPQSSVFLSEEREGHPDPPPTPSIHYPSALGGIQHKAVVTFPVNQRRSFTKGCRPHLRHIHGCLSENKCASVGTSFENKVSIFVCTFRNSKLRHDWNGIKIFFD